MIDIGAIFEAFGGGKEIARICGVSDQAASNMKTRGSIPSRRWPALIEEAKRRVGADDVTPAQSAVLEQITFETLSSISQQAAA